MNANEHGDRLMLRCIVRWISAGFVIPSNSDCEINFKLVDT